MPQSASVVVFIALVLLAMTSLLLYGVVVFASWTLVQVFGRRLQTLWSIDQIYRGGFGRVERQEAVSNLGHASPSLRYFARRALLHSLLNWCDYSELRAETLNGLHLLGARDPEIIAFVVRRLPRLRNDIGLFPEDYSRAARVLKLLRQMGVERSSRPPRDTIALFGVTIWLWHTHRWGGDLIERDLPAAEQGSVSYARFVKCMANIDGAQ